MKYMYLVMKDISVHGDFNDTIHTSEPYLLFQSSELANDYIEKENNKLGNLTDNFFINKIKVEDAD